MNVQNWTTAARSCRDEGSILAEPKTFESIFTAIEALTIHGIREEAWIGGQKIEGEANFYWSDNQDLVDTANWALEFPLSASSSCMHQSADDGFFRNINCSLEMPYICQKYETYFSETTSPSPTRFLVTTEEETTLSFTTDGLTTDSTYTAETTETAETIITSTSTEPVTTHIITQTTVQQHVTTATTISNVPTMTTTSTSTSTSGLECNCGIANKKTRIVGGVDTEVNAYPWQVWEYL